MSDATQNILTRAYELIENDKLDEAKTILEPLVTEDQDNPDVWWLYAHATDDVVEARKALLQVNKIDPQYPGLAELLEEAADVEPVPAQPSSGLKDLRKLPSRPVATASASSLDDAFGEDIDLDEDFASSDDDEDDEEEFFDELYGDEESSSKRSLLVRILVVALVVVVIFIFGLLIITSGNQRGTGTETPPAVAQTTDEPTDMPVATETAAATDEMMTDEPATVETEASPTETAPLATETIDSTLDATMTDEPTIAATEIDADAQSVPFAVLYSALSEYSVPDDGIAVADTDLGSTTVVRVCTEANVDGTGVLSAVMSILVDEIDTLDDGVDAIAVHIGDCDQPAASRIVAVSVADVTAFTSGDIDENEFRRRWQPVG